MCTHLIFGNSCGFAAAVQPGPLQTFVVSRALANGRLSTFPAIFVPLVTDGPILLLALLLDHGGDGNFESTRLLTGSGAGPNAPGE